MKIRDQLLRVVSLIRNQRYNDPLAYADLILNSKLNVLFEQTDMSINDSGPVHNDWAAAYYIIIFCELIPRTDTEDIRKFVCQPISAARAWSMSFCSVSACFFSVMAPTMGSPTILPLRSTT